MLRKQIFFFTSKDQPQKSVMKKRIEKRLSDVHQHPPYQRAQRQTASRVEIIKKRGKPECPRHEGKVDSG